MSDQQQTMDSEDYRDSHASRGASYDTILSAPFDAYMDKWEGLYLAQVLARLFPAPIPRYLDFACGTGRITQRVEPLALEACGVDISESMLSIARGKCHSTRFVCTDLTRNDVELGLFDLITSFRFFGNAQDELRAAALAAINRHLRKGGYLIINNHRNPRSLRNIAHRATGGPDAGMDLTHAKLRELLRKHQFEIVHQHPIGCWLYRSKLVTAEVLESKRADKLERLFRYSWLTSISPDALLVAQKTA